MGITLLMTHKFNLDKILNDQRIVKAKELISEAIQDYQSAIFGSKTTSISTNTSELNSAAKLRGGKLFSHTLVQA